MFDRVLLQWPRLARLEGDSREVLSYFWSTSDDEI